MSSGLFEKDSKHQKVFTRKEAADYLRVGISTLDSKLKVKFIKIGRSKRYLQSDLDSFLLSCREGGSDD